MALLIAMPKKPHPQNEPRPVTAADRALVKRLTGQIIQRSEELEMTRIQLGRKAGRESASTLFGWRNGDTERPSLLDVNDFANAVGLTIELVQMNNGAGARSGLGVSTSGDTLKPETTEVVRIMELLPDDVRAQVRDAALKRIAELTEPDPDEPTPPDNHHRQN